MKVFILIKLYALIQNKYYSFNPCKTSNGYKIKTYQILDFVYVQQQKTISSLSKTDI